MNNIPSKDNISGLQRENFRKEINGKTTDLYIMRNANGMEVAATNYGCALLAIMVPDRNGKPANVLLGHDSIEAVINSPEPFLNTIIGRYGNRIAKGHFVLNGHEYNLNINNGPNSLHGGPTGFHARVWDVVDYNDRQVVFQYHSNDGEEGFPGNLSVRLTYTLDDTNALTISYHATTDQPTIVNLTSHGFFNLAGVGHPTPTIDNHILTIHADHYLPIDADSIPTGEILKVEGTPMDFRQPHAVGERINANFEQLRHGSGYDHCYVLRKPVRGELSLAACCTDPQSGRQMEVLTTEVGMQLYTGNWLNGFAGYHGATYPARSGVCFEAQCFPDSPNKAHFPSAVLLPGEEYSQTTIYRFSCSERK